MKRILAREGLWLTGAILGTLLMVALVYFFTMPMYMTRNPNQLPAGVVDVPHRGPLGAEVKRIVQYRNNQIEFPVGSPNELIRTALLEKFPELAAAEAKLEADRRARLRRDEIALVLSLGVGLGVLVYLVIGLGRVTLWSLKTVRKP